MMGVGSSNIVTNNDGIISGPTEDHTPDSRGLGCAILDTMLESGDHLAQVDAITGEKETYESLLKRCIRTAIKMRSKGITSDHIITICSYNNIHNSVPYIASIFLGAKIACLDPELNPRDTTLLLSQICPKMIFAGPEAIELLENSIRESGITTEIIIFGKSTVYEEFSTFLVPSPEEANFFPYRPLNLNETAGIVFSSGTTGSPKGACISHKAILSQGHHMWKEPERIPISEFLRSQLTFISLYWIPVATVFLHCVFYKKCRVIYPKFDIDTFWNVIETTQVEFVLLTPNEVQKLCTRGRPEKANIPHLVQIITTGGPVSKEQILEMRHMFPGVYIINMYGCSEAGGYSMAFRPHTYTEERTLLLQKPNSCGRPREGVACKVVDNETGEILGPHLKGELRIKTDFQMTGYYNMDSSRCWDADGWLKTGEISYYDEDNCFFIVDRMKDMLKFRSWYLAPAKIEGILLSHPAVDAVVVVGLPHPEDGEHPVAVVVLRAHAVSTITGEDIQDYVDQRVEDHYRLRGTRNIVTNNEGIISGPTDDITLDSRGFGCALFDRMIEGSAYLAQVDAITGEEETYESLLKRCIRTAIKMRSKGITSDHIIAISSYNNFHNSVPYIASLFLGATITYLDPELNARDTALLLNQIRPKMIFAEPEAIQLFEDSVRESGITTELIVFGKSTLYEEFSTFLVHSPEETTFLPYRPLKLNKRVAIVYSSGTTGLPKGACISHKALLSQVNYLWMRPQFSIVNVNFTREGAASYPITEIPNNQMTFISLHWISSVTTFLICVFFKKCRVIYPKFDIDTFWDVIEKSQVQFILLTPNDLQKLCIKGRPEKVNIPHLVQIITTGGPVTKEQILEMRHMFPGVYIINLYGSSEAGGYSMSFRPLVYKEEKKLLLKKPDSCGRPREGVSCKVVDIETGKILGPHQKGELRIKTKFQMSGYFNMKSSSCWDPQGWLKTGEISYYDEDYCFFIVDRMKDMLKFRSWYLAPAKIEGILLSHPAVDSVVVVGLPHPADGEHPVAVVVLRSHAVGTVTSEDIQNYVDERVEDHYRLRGGVRFVGYIPVTSSGKNRRAAVKDLLLKNEI
ncbi:hypothetical protein ILUMI_10336 [Ignelater luminosus]|uniref:Luciferin 4-monooxygenase n=1 Tax=Ignelater luminosus TaxID=2038154 RepID=A0A8K0D7B3_IGNLU|nr:hypothetical protein ILUMI_10336 [Ignelater luminosus]